MAILATGYLQSETDLLLADVVVAETMYVLESFYEAPWGQVAQAMRWLVGFDSVVCVDPALLWRTIEIYEVDRIDSAEAYLLPLQRAPVLVESVLSTGLSIEFKVINGLSPPIV